MFKLITPNRRLNLPHSSFWTSLEMTFGCEHDDSRQSWITTWGSDHDLCLSKALIPRIQLQTEMQFKVFCKMILSCKTMYMDLSTTDNQPAIAHQQSLRHGDPFSSACLPIFLIIQDTRT